MYPHESNENAHSSDLPWLAHGSSLKITCNFDDKPNLILSMNEKVCLMQDLNITRTIGLIIIYIVYGIF